MFGEGAEIRIELSGDREVSAVFEALPESSRKNILAPVMRRIADDFASRIRADAPVDTGLLRRAIGATRVKTYEHALFATVGARRGFRRVVAARRGGGSRLVRGSASSADARKEMIRNPVKYLHLVTGGRKAVEAREARVLYSHQADRFFGRRVAPASPNPFVERTFQSISASALSDFLGDAVEGIVSEAGRLARSVSPS